MVAVGRGLMSGASLLLIDEPSIGLSPIMKKAVFGAIEKIKNETDITVLIVEQEVDYPLKAGRSSLSAQKRSGFHGKTGR